MIDQIIYIIHLFQLLLIVFSSQAVQTKMRFHILGLHFLPMYLFRDQQLVKNGYSCTPDKDI